jgi:hypothetical protein
MGDLYRLPVIVYEEVWCGLFFILVGTFAHLAVRSLLQG